MGALSIIGLFFIVGKLIYEATAPNPPAGKTLDLDKMTHDALLSGTSQGISKKQFQKNVRNNKYYK